MEQFLPRILDNFLRQHPIAAALSLLLLSLIGAWILTASGHEFLVYEGF